MRIEWKWLDKSSKEIKPVWTWGVPPSLCLRADWILPIIIQITAVTTLSNTGWGLEVLRGGEGVSPPGCPTLVFDKWGKGMMSPSLQHGIPSQTFPRPQSSWASFLFSAQQLPPSMHGQDVTLLLTDLHLNKHCQTKQCASGREHAGLSSPPSRLILARLARAASSDKQCGRKVLAPVAG